MADGKLASVVMEAARLWLTCMLIWLVAVNPLLSLACTVKLKGPLAVGVPESTPPLVKVKPPGKVLPVTTLHVYGPVSLLVVKVLVYSVPTEAKRLRSVTGLTLKPVLPVTGFTVKV